MTCEAVQAECEEGCVTSEALRVACETVHAGCEAECVTSQGAQAVCEAAYVISWHHFNADTICYNAVTVLNFISITSV